METASTSPQYQMIVAGWLLAASALLGAGVMALVNWHSMPLIVENERLDLLRSLNAVIPERAYDNDILSDTRKVVAHELLGSTEPSTVFRARKAGAPAAAALTVVAPNGYTGPIVILVGVSYDGRITGVRVVKHRETPGLGDGIEAHRSHWIEGFKGKSLVNPQAAGWKVKRDGGEFDQLTGATITPRAVAGAVHKALQYFEQNRRELFLPVESHAVKDEQ